MEFLNLLFLLRVFPEVYLPLKYDLILNQFLILAAHQQHIGGLLSPQARERDVVLSIALHLLFDYPQVVICRHLSREEIKAPTRWLQALLTHYFPFPAPPHPPDPRSVPSPYPFH